MIPEEEVSEFLESQGIGSADMAKKDPTTITEEESPQAFEEPIEVDMSKKSQKYEDILIKLNKKQEEKDVATRELARLEAEILALKVGLEILDYLVYLFFRERSSS